MLVVLSFRWLYADMPLEEPRGAPPTPCQTSSSATSGNDNFNATTSESEDLSNSTLEDDSEGEIKPSGRRPSAAKIKKFLKAPFAKKGKVEKGSDSTREGGSSDDRDGSWI